MKHGWRIQFWGQNYNQKYRNRNQPHENGLKLYHRFCVHVPQVYELSPLHMEVITQNLGMMVLV